MWSSLVCIGNSDIDTPGYFCCYRRLVRFSLKTLDFDRRILFRMIRTQFQLQESELRFEPIKSPSRIELQLQPNLGVVFVTSIPHPLLLSVCSDCFS